MVGRVVEAGSISDPLPVINGTKQGCVMAPLLFSIVFSAMLYNAFKDCDRGVKIRFRKDGSVFNLQRLKAETKTLCVMLHELLYADDCTLIAHTLEDAQLVDHVGLTITISIKKTEVLHQPRPDTPPMTPAITIGNEVLKAVDKFCDLVVSSCRTPRLTLRSQHASIRPALPTDVWSTVWGQSVASD